MSSGENSLWGLLGGIVDTVADKAAKLKAELEKAADEARRTAVFNQVEGLLVVSYMAYFKKNDWNFEEPIEKIIVNLIAGLRWSVYKEAEFKLIRVQLDNLYQAIAARDKAPQDIQKQEAVSKALVELLIARINSISPQDSVLPQDFCLLLDSVLQLSQDFPPDAELLLLWFEKKLLILLSQIENEKLQKTLPNFLETSRQELKEKEKEYRASGQKTLDTLEKYVEPLKGIVSYMSWNEIIAHLHETIKTSADPCAKAAQVKFILESFIDVSKRKKAFEQKITIGDILQFVHALLELSCSLNVKVQDEESIGQKFYKMIHALKEFWQELEDANREFQEPMDGTFAVGPVVVDMTMFENNMAVRILTTAKFNEKSIDSCMRKLKRGKEYAKPILDMEVAHKKSFIELREKYKKLRELSKVSRRETEACEIDDIVESFLNDLNDCIDGLSQEMAKYPESEFSKLLAHIQKAAEELLLLHRLEFQQPYCLGRYKFRVMPQDKRNLEKNVIYVSLDGHCAYVGSNTEFIQYDLPKLELQTPRLKGDILKALAAEKKDMVYTKEQDWIYTLANLCRALNRAIRFGIEISNLVTNKSAVEAKLAAAGIFYNAETKQYKFNANSPNAKEYHEYMLTGQMYTDAIAWDKPEVNDSEACRLCKQYFTLDLFEYMTSFDKSDAKAERELYAAFQEARNFGNDMNWHGEVQIKLENYQSRGEETLLLAEKKFIQYNETRQSLREIKAKETAERIAALEAEILSLESQIKNTQKAFEEAEAQYVEHISYSESQAQKEMSELGEQISDAVSQLRSLTLVISENNAAKEELEKQIEAIKTESEHLSSLKERADAAGQTIKENEAILVQCDEENERIKAKKQRGVEREGVLKQQEIEITEKIKRLKEIETELEKKGGVESRIAGNIKLKEEAQTRVVSLNDQEKNERVRLIKSNNIDLKLRSNKKHEILKLDPEMLWGEPDIKMGIQKLNVSIDTFIQNNPIFSEHTSVFLHPFLWRRYFFDSKRDKEVGSMLLAIQTALKNSDGSAKSLFALAIDLKKIIREYPELPEKQAIQGFLNKIKVYQLFAERNDLNIELGKIATKLTELPHKYEQLRAVEMANIQNAEAQITEATTEKRRLEDLEKEKLRIEVELINGREASKLVEALYAVSDESILSEPKLKLESEDEPLPYDHYIQAELKLIEEENKRLDAERKKNAQFRLNTVENTRNERNKESVLLEKQAKITLVIKGLTANKEALERQKGNLETLIKKKEDLTAKKETLAGKIESLQSELKTKQEKQAGYKEKCTVLEGQKDEASALSQKMKAECEPKLESKKAALKQYQEDFDAQIVEQRRLEAQASKLRADIQFVEQKSEQPKTLSSTTESKQPSLFPALLMFGAANSAVVDAKTTGGVSKTVISTARHPNSVSGDSPKTDATKTKKKKPLQRTPNIAPASAFFLPLPNNPDEQTAESQLLKKIEII